MKILVFSLFLPLFVSSLKCHLCDTFDGYCSFDDRKCVGSRCAKRSVILDNGMIRVQKFCQSSDTPPGCRAAILWQGLPGEECVCDDGDFCNNSNSTIYSVIYLIILIYMI